MKKKKKEKSIQFYKFKDHRRYLRVSNLFLTVNYKNFAFCYYIDLNLS